VSKGQRGRGKKNGKGYRVNQSPAAASYRVWWRDTTAPRWDASTSRPVSGATSLVLKDVNIDDWFFGVSSVSAEGWESPVEFPGEAGAFGAPVGAR
jgi:hypothetical protein